MSGQQTFSDHNNSLAARILEANILEQSDMDMVLREAKQSQLDIYHTILKLGIVEEELLLPIACEEWGVSFIKNEHGLILDQDALEALTLPYASKFGLAPICGDNGAVSLAMTDPSNQSILREISFYLGHDVNPLGATANVVRRLLAQSEGKRQHKVNKVAFSHAESNVDSSDAPVVRFVQQLLSDAVVQGASDVHFESTEGNIAVRYRLNGILVPQASDPTIDPDAIISRLKILSSMNVAERRLPQDGRIQAILAGRKVDFRLSTIPTVLGESIVCRVLDRKSLRVGWDKLGFEPETVDSVRQIIEAPNGLFLVTGPTGSGKTTTLYTALTHLNIQQKKIVTVEDPVEYELPGIQQVQVREEIGMTFARVLRSFLRHDPNVIMVGEIRDEETAEIACRAAQVGRLVLSTLHTNSADAAFSRLVDFGVPEFLVHSVLRGVLSQDLKIQICQNCLGTGCTSCNNLGAVGRKLVTKLKIYNTD